MQHLLLNLPSFGLRSAEQELLQPQHNFAFPYASAEEVKQALLDAKAKTSTARTDLKATEARLSEVNRQIRLTGQYLGNKAVYAEY